MKRCWLGLLLLTTVHAQEVSVLLHTRSEGAQVCWGRKRFVCDFYTGQTVHLVYGPEGPLYRRVTQYPLLVRKPGFRDLHTVIRADQMRGPLELDLGTLEAISLAGWLQLHPLVPPLGGLTLLALVAGIWARHRQQQARRLAEFLRSLEKGRDRDPNIGRTVGPYYLVELLGVGGMARVYRAVLSRQPDQEMAVKLLSLRAGLTREARLRFHAEVKINARLRHPNLALLYEPLEIDGEVGLVMELLRGHTLRRKRPNLTPQLLEQMGAGLSYLHQNDIIHRDLKPENLFLTESGILKIMDLGISIQLGQERMTGDGAVLGTLAYMSPEQIQGKTLSFTSDQYSLGIILYEWLTGELPFHDETPRGLAVQHLQVDAVPPSYVNPQLSAELDAVLLRMLAKEPAERYAQLSQAISALASQLPTV